MPQALASKETGEDSQRCTCGIGGGSAHAVEKIKNRSLHVEFSRDQHGEHKERKADDRIAPECVFVLLQQLGKCPYAEQADRHADDVAVWHDRITDEEQHKAYPPGQIEDEMKRSHGC